MAVVFDHSTQPTRAELQRWRREGPPFDRIDCPECGEVMWSRDGLAEGETGGDFEKVVAQHRCRRRAG
jgi:hypothetical protein